MDTWFGGQISKEALAALSLAFPVFFIVVAFSSGLGTGTTALVANAMGAGRADEARSLAGQSMWFAVLVGALVTGLGFGVSEGLFRWMGAEGSYLQICMDYIGVIFAGCTFFMLSSTLNGFLQARGDTVTFRNSLIAGSILNVGLDPLFLYGWGPIPALGIKGIAASTILIQGLVVVYMYVRCVRAGCFPERSWLRVRPCAGAFKELFQQGAPASVNMLTVGAGIFVINWFASKFGTDAVAAFGAATRIEQVALLPTIGLNMAAMAIAGQNSGAGRIDRIQEMLTTALKGGAVVCVIGALPLLIWPVELMRLFSEDPEVMRMGAAYLRVAAITLFVYPVLFTCTSTLQGMKRPQFAIWLGLARQLIAPMAVISILAWPLGMETNGIWWGVSLVNWVAAFFTWWYVHRVLRRVAAG